MTICQWLRRLFRPRLRPRLPMTPEIRAMLVEVNVRRITTAAKREGMEPARFEDAIRLLAEGSPLTMGEVLDMVEVDGLDATAARLEESNDGR